MTDYSTLTDMELSDLLRTGDPLAYTEIYNRYKGLLYVHIFKRIGDREATKDIIHELFCQLWYKREELIFKTNLSGYLFKSVRNQLLNVIAHKKVETRYIASLQSVIDKDEVQADFQLRENEIMALIAREIAALPPKMRKIFELSRNENLSHKEIAVKLDLSEKTVKKQINNALKILRVKLGFFVLFLF